MIRGIAMKTYLTLCAVAILPVIVAVFLYYLDKNTAFGNARNITKQIIYGIIFGILAILGTECGVPLNGAQINCRDACVLIAGLMFGAPAGIIAGVIGATERWIAVAWGVGTFTRVACTIATLIAGFYSAALRKYMFEDKKPGWFISAAIGVVMEVFHMTMIFITNMSDPDRAIAVVQTCSAPMIISNGVSVMVAAILLVIISGELKGNKEKHQVRISQTIQRWLLVTVVLAFIVTSFFILRLQNTIAIDQTDKLLDLALDETVADISDASDKNILDATRRINEELQFSSLEATAAKYNVTEISLIDKNGVIFESSVPRYENYDMAKGEQSAEFLCLLGDTQEFVQDYGPISTDPSIDRKYAGIKTDYGFLQVGYDAERFQLNIDEEVVGITQNRHVGETGYVLVIDKLGFLVSAPEGITDETLAADGASIGEVPERTTVRMSMSGEEVYCRYCGEEGYYIISVYPFEEAMQTRDVAMYVNTYLEILVFAVLFAIIYMLIKRIVVNQIDDINASLAKITGGDLNEVVDVRSNQEFASLSDDINRTVDTLKRYIAEASARIDAELEVAKDIQSSALPNIFPAFPKRKDFDIYASMMPAKEVGGDFYDFYMTGSNSLHFLVADVSGKGIPAAMFMMRAKTELKTLTEADIPLNDVFTTGNRALCEGNDAGMFVTAWQGSIDLESGHMQYVCAGHNPPLVRHADGKFEYLRTRAGFILAGMETVSYKIQELQLSPGDIVYLYTDGVTEATNANNELFGDERLLEAVNSAQFDNMQQLCDIVKAEVDAFVGEAPQFDDITMVAFRYFGEAPAPEITFEEATLDDIPKVIEFVETELEKLDFPMKSTMQMSVAIDELMSNIVRYAYPNRNGYVNVKLIAKEDPNRVYIRFEDEGIPYNPLKNEDPDTTLSAEDRQIGGLGIFIVKKTMDDVKYKYENGKNILTIKKCY